MRGVAFFLLALACGTPGSGLAAEGDLQRRQAEAKRDQESLQARIARLQKQISGSESSRRDVSVALRESESAISELDRKLETLAADTRQAEAGLKDVQQRILAQNIELEARQGRLAEQLRAQYAGGLSPWATLLSGEDPQDIARELGYLEYVSRAQADAIRAVRQTLEELAALKAQAQSHEADLRRLAQETSQRRSELETQRAERQKVLARIEDELKQQRSEARHLAGNEERLSKLVDALTVAIEEEAAAARRRAEEARRLEQERRRAEEKRLAEQRRLAEAQRMAETRRQDEARAETARKIEAARQAAQQIRESQAAAQGAADPAIEAASDGRLAGRAEGLAPAAEPAAAPEQPAAVPASRSPALQEGLSKGLPYPVRGEVQGRFGMERPEGGVWRGIVLRAAEGARVAAVAPGKVVYAGWLGGFGNLMIVDHGAGYLSVYAYNQGLLKQVGDPVRAGEAIATVGATGGQVEPGLYFEIRHDGKPVNPLLWLGKS